MLDSDLELDRQPVDLALLTPMLYLKTRNLELAQLPSKDNWKEDRQCLSSPFKWWAYYQRDKSMKMFTSKNKAKWIQNESA